MFAKLIALLLQAKAGAVSGVFLLGATGALISVSAANGVTTITITQASPSASASHSASPTPSGSPTATPTGSATPTASPSGSPTGSACADEAKALAFQVRRVDSAFSGFHTDLMKLRGQRSVADIEKADVMLKVIRQAAVKAIHATATQACRHDDEDTDTDEDEAHEAAPATALTLTGDRSADEANDGDHAKPKPAPMTFTGDAASIATQAIAAMQTAFETAKNAPASSPRPSPSHRPEPSRSPHGTPGATHRHD